MKTYFDVLVAEMKDKTYGRIIVKQIDPGAMDTDMQEDIRNANVSSEQLDKLKNLYENNNLKQPKDVAEMIIQSIREIL
jgi:NADP-dependent 3-hydroxy acid dehydrogenase YdfG